MVTHAYLWNILTLVVSIIQSIWNFLSKDDNYCDFFSCSLYMQAVGPRTSPLSAFGGRPQNGNAQFCSTWAWNWRSHGMLHWCCVCNFMDEWAVLWSVLTGQSIFWKQIFFPPCYIYFVPFVNISFVVRLTCCYLQNQKQFKRVNCFQTPKICKESTVSDEIGSSV